MTCVPASAAAPSSTGSRAELQADAGALQPFGRRRRPIPRRSRRAKEYPPITSMWWRAYDPQPERDTGSCCSHGVRTECGGVMLSIGDFARLGGVSVRMLRHYDDLGLLQPAEVDRWTGRRRYQTGQLAELNRLVALKELGFTLRQVGELLHEGVEAAQLRGMLQLRRAELEQQAQETWHRLAQVDARLRLIETEDAMSEQKVVVQRVEPMRLAALTEIASVIHHGPVEGVTYAYQALARWAENDGHEIDGDARKQRMVFLEAGGDDQTDWIVEIQLELR